MSTLLSEVFQEMETSATCGGSCNCPSCARNRMLNEQEVFRFSLEIPQSEMESEFEAGARRGKIAAQVRYCLSQLAGVVVKPSEQAREIVLELERDINTNLLAGDRFKFKIYRKLQDCLRGFKNVKIEVETKRKKLIEMLSPAQIKKLREHLKNQKLNPWRFLDIRVLNRNKVVARVETKKGDSPYYPSQKGKDLTFKEPTFVARKCRCGGRHPDCADFRKKNCPKSREITVLQEIFNEVEI